MEQANGRRYLIKRAPAYLSDEEFAVTMGLHRGLFERGAPVSELVLGRSGRPFEWVDGFVVGVQKLEFATWRGVPEEEAAAFGQALANLHDTGASMGADWPSGDWSFPVQRHHWLPDAPAALAAASAHWARAPGVDPQVAKTLGERARAFRMRCALGELSQSFIHGDASSQHCLMKPDGPVLIDFDELRWGYCIFDMSQALSTLGGFDLRESGMQLRDGWNWSAMRSFRMAYELVRPLRHAERQTLLDWLGLVIIRIAAGEMHIDDPGETPNPSTARSAEKLLELLSTLEERRAQWNEAF